MAVTSEVAVEDALANTAQVVDLVPVPVVDLDQATTPVLAAAVHLALRTQNRQRTELTLL